MLRKIGAIVAGVLIVGGVVATLQLIGTRLYPPPEGFDPRDPAGREDLLRYLAGLPLAAWLHVFASEIIGAFLGALAAGRIARDAFRWFSGVIIALALCGSIFNWVSFPHPTWFIVAQVVAYPLALLLVWRLLDPSRRGPAAPPAATG